MLKNTDDSYGLISICLHWGMALSIFFMFGLGLYMVELSYYDAWYKGSLDLHKSLGVILFGLLAIRFSHRMIGVVPKGCERESAFATLEAKVAKLVHCLLYLLMAVLMSSGYLISTADGRGIEVFTLFEVPAMPALVENQEDIAGELHELFAWTLLLVSLAHALAALKHHFVDKDETLRRMLQVTK